MLRIAGVIVCGLIVAVAALENRVEAQSCIGCVYRPPVYKKGHRFPPPAIIRRIPVTTHPNAHPPHPK